MRIFKGHDNKAWQISVDVAQLKAVREQTGVDLFRLFDDEMALLTQLTLDPCKLVDVIWVLCREQAREAGVSDEQFGRGMGGDVLQRATEAFVEAVIDFFPEQQARWNLMTAKRKGKEIQQKTLERMQGRLEAIDPEAEASRILGGDPSPNASAGTAPGQPASSPGATPSPS